MLGTGNRILRGDHRASYTGLGKLTINPVSVSDEGWYTCAAVNEDGQGSNSSLYLSVISKCDWHLPLMKFNSRKFYIVPAANVACSKRIC